MPPINPPIAPLIVFPGLMLGASFGPLIKLPMRYAKVSVSIVIAKIIIKNAIEKPAIPA